MRQNKNYMTVEDISGRFGYSKSSIISNFNRTAASIKKKYNIILTRGKDENGNLFYQITDGRANTIYDEGEERKVKISKKILKFENFQFTVFLGIVMTPWGVFRGTREEFLKYISIKKNKKNLEALDEALLSLMNKEYIAFHEDGKHIIVYIREKIEEEMKLGSKMVKQCREIAKKHNKTIDKVPQLIKVWLAVQICFQHQPFTNNDIGKLTDLSNYQIRDAIQLLQESDIFKITRAGSYCYCKGSNVDLTAWWND